MNNGKFNYQILFLIIIITLLNVRGKEGKEKGGSLAMFLFLKESTNLNDTTRNSKEDAKRHVMARFPS